MLTTKKDLFLFCRPLRLPQPLNIYKATKGGKLDWLGVWGRDRLSGWCYVVGTIYRTGHVWVQLNARGLYLLVIGQLI